MDDVRDVVAYDRACLELTAASTSDGGESTRAAAVRVEGLELVDELACSQGGGCAAAILRRGRPVRELPCAD